jgi:hypothetical protein
MYIGENIMFIRIYKMYFGEIFLIKYKLSKIIVSILIDRKRKNIMQ